METADIDMNSYQSMIDPIVNRNFGNRFHHQNGPKFNTPKKCQPEIPSNHHERTVPAQKHWSKTSA